MVQVMSQATIRPLTGSSPAMGKYKQIEIFKAAIIGSKTFNFQYTF
jgi:hypothetical protein